MAKACEYALVDDSTVSKWKKTAAQADAKSPRLWSSHQRRCVDFFNAVRKADADFYVGGVAKIVAAANKQVLVKTVMDEDGKTTRTEQEVAGDWHAIEKVLTKRFPAEWGDRQAVELMGEGGGPIRTVTQEDVFAEIEAYRREQAAKPEPPASENGHA